MKRAENAILSLLSGANSVAWRNIIERSGNEYFAELNEANPYGPEFPMSRPVTPYERMAGTTRLELATSAVTGQRSNQLNYVPNRGINNLA